MVVEGKHPRRDFGIADTTIRTGKLFTEGIGLILGFNLDNAICLRKGKLHGLKKPPLDTLSQGNPVDNHINFMFLVLIKLNFLGKVDNTAIQSDLRKTLFSQLFYFLAVFPFLPRTIGARTVRFVPEGKDKIASTI